MLSRFWLKNHESIHFGTFSRRLSETNRFFTVINIHVIHDSPFRRIDSTLYLNQDLGRISSNLTTFAFGFQFNRWKKGSKRAPNVFLKRTCLVTFKSPERTYTAISERAIKCTRKRGPELEKCLLNWHPKFWTNLPKCDPKPPNLTIDPLQFHDLSVVYYE